MAWFDDRLVVAGESLEQAGTADPAASSGVWAYDPNGRSWATLPSPPFNKVTIVAAGDHLVAVGPVENVFPTDNSSGARAELPVSWATWQPGDTEWVERSSVQAAARLAVPRSPGASGNAQLVWTGERVLDVTHGAALDPASGIAETMAIPDDLAGFSHLILSTVVRAGNEVVLSSWSSRPGLAWNATGDSYREIPGPSTAQQNWLDSASVAGADGSVLLVTRAGGDGGRVMAFDPVDDSWAELPDVPVTEVSGVLPDLPPGAYRSCRYTSATAVSPRRTVAGDRRGARRLVE